MILLYRDTIDVGGPTGYDRIPTGDVKASVFGIRVPLWFAYWLLERLQ